MMKKRFISVLLALCLVISLLPVSALAEEAPQTSAEETVTEPAAEGSGSAPAGTAAPFHQSEDIGGVTITVDADAGVFPADAKLSAAMIVDESDIAQIEDAVEAEAGVPSEQSFTFDIRVLDAGGNELQPDPDKGEVRVSFAADAITEAAADEDMSVQVYHVDDALDTAEPVETSVTEDNPAGETPAAEIVAEHFSYYTITTATTWTDLPTTAGSTLSGNYKLSSSATIAASTGVSGLNISGDVRLYLPADVKLTVKGGNGSGATPGGAGIYLPSDAKLYLLGKGSVDATGGSAGSGGNGSSGTAGTFGPISGGQGYLYTGAGGGGAGAGIGGSGGNGGAGGGGGSGAAGGVGYWANAGQLNPASDGGKGGANSGADGGSVANVTMNRSSSGGQGCSAGTAGGNGTVYKASTATITTAYTNGSDTGRDGNTLFEVVLNPSDPRQTTALTDSKVNMLYDSSTRIYDAAVETSTYSLAGYVLKGWYDKDGTKIANADGSLVAGVSGYTDVSGVWTYFGDTAPTLYAQWISILYVNITKDNEAAEIRDVFSGANGLYISRNNTDFFPLSYSAPTYSIADDTLPKGTGYHVYYLRNGSYVKLSAGVTLDSRYTGKADFAYYSVSAALTNLTGDGQRLVGSGGSYTGSVLSGAGFVTTLLPASGYKCGTAAAFVGGTKLDAAAYGFNAVTGELSIPAAAITGAVSITAAGTPISYTIAYHTSAKPDSGSYTTAAMDGTTVYEKTVTNGASVTLSDGKGLSMSGWTLSGWAKTSDATTAEYSLGANVDALTLMDGAIISLYAVWQNNGSTSTYPTSLQNGSFETPLNTNFVNFYNYSSTEDISRKTSASDRMIELGSVAGSYAASAGSAYHTTTAADGNQFAELNANLVGALYQDISTVPNTKLYYGFSHKARQADETMDLWLGSPDTISAALAIYKKYTNGTTTASSGRTRPGWGGWGGGPTTTYYTIEQAQAELKNLAGLTIVRHTAEYSASNYTKWDNVTGSYVVPDGQGTTEFAFVSWSSPASNSCGNLLDNVYFSTAKPTQTANVTIRASFGGYLVVNDSSETTSKLTYGNTYSRDLANGTKMKISVVANDGYNFNGGFIDGVLYKNKADFLAACDNLTWTVGGNGSQQRLRSVLQGKHRDLPAGGRDLRYSGKDAGRPGQ